MKAVVYEKQGVFQMAQRPEPALQGPKDAIVRVTLASICTSDLHIRNGAVPRAQPGVIVGHEMVGEVVETGREVRHFRAGDRVTVNVETFCGECYFCKRGYVNNCADPHGGWALGCRIDGGQAEYVRVPYADQGLNHIPENVTDKQALFVGDILATGYWGARIAEIEAGSTVAVLGAGPTGLCAMQCARLYHPAHIIAIDPLENRRIFAAQQGFADIVIDPDAEDADAILRKLTNGRGADIVLEAAGGTNTFEQAWKLARPNATVCIIALYESPQVLPLPQMYGKNLTFKFGGVDAADCAEILRLIAEGRLDTANILTHTFPLAQAMEAYALFESRKDGVLKVALKP